MEAFVALIDLPEYCENLKAQLQKKQIILLNGPLGVGKTQLVKTMVSAMGGQMPDSPTFSIINQYPCSKRAIYHVDLYRLENEDDIESTGFWDLFREEEALIFIEWAEKIPDNQWPKNWSRKNLTLSFTDKTDIRKIQTF